MDTSASRIVSASQTPHLCKIKSVYPWFGLSCCFLTNSTSTKEQAQQCGIINNLLLKRWLSKVKYVKKKNVLLINVKKRRCEDIHLKASFNLFWSLASSKENNTPQNEAEAYLRHLFPPLGALKGAGLQIHLSAGPSMATSTCIHRSVCQLPFSGKVPVKSGSSGNKPIVMSQKAGETFVRSPTVAPLPGLLVGDTKVSFVRNIELEDVELTNSSDAKWESGTKCIKVFNYELISRFCRLARWRQTRSEAAWSRWELHNEAIVICSSQHAPPFTPHTMEQQRRILKYKQRFFFFFFEDKKKANCR